MSIALRILLSCASFIYPSYCTFLSIHNLLFYILKASGKLKLNLKLKGYIIISIKLKISQSYSWKKREFFLLKGKI